MKLFLLNSSLVQTLLILLAVNPSGHLATQEPLNKNLSSEHCRHLIFEVVLIGMGIGGGVGIGEVPLVAHVELELEIVLFISELFKSVLLIIVLFNTVEFKL